jgi:hypothetical protein
VDFLDDVVASFATARRIGRDRQRRRRQPRQYVPVVETPWLRVAAMCVLVLTAALAAALVLVVVGLGALMTDDVLGLGILAMFGPFLVGGLVAMLPVVVAGAVTTRRAWTGDGSVRLELALAGVVTLAIVVFTTATVAWLPMLVLGLPAAALVGIAVWPTPWQRADER